MTSINKKLEEVHIDLWGPHNPVFLFGSVYTAIPICKKTKKTWVLYFRSKDKFVDVFQIWFPKVENKSNYTIKAFYANN